MHKERLQQMVTMLRGLPEGKRKTFDLDEWQYGTSACAVGYACLDPVFNGQGLRFEGLSPEFADNRGWDAVTAFFQIDPGDACQLFEISSYSTRGNTTPAQVADRIEAFIAE
jgi:hypothetical protein